MVSPVSSPLTRVVPPSVWCLLGTLWCPRMLSPLRVVPPRLCRPPFSVVSPRSSVVSPYVVPPSVLSPLARVVPPSVWCLPGGWDNMWYPLHRPPLPVSSPLTRVVPPFSVVSPRSSVVSPFIVPPSAWSPLVISRDMSSPRCFK